MVPREKIFRMLNDWFEVQEMLRENSLPASARKHFQQAKKEGLLGIRAVLDSVIEEMDARKEGKFGNVPVRRQKINIEE